MAVTTGIPEAAHRFLDGRAKALWIDSEYVDATSDTTITVYNPADGSELGDVQEASAADVDRAVVSSRAAFDGVWAGVTPADRSLLLWRIADIVVANLED
jgi:acyl-CoA reductase-like NAD-dependent aldehyde dehydrogenase